MSIKDIQTEDDLQQDASNIVEADSVPQTETEGPEDEQLRARDPEELTAVSADHQDETGSAADDAGSLAAEEKKDAESQTEKKPARKRSSAAKATPKRRQGSKNSDEETQSDSEEPDSSGSEAESNEPTQSGEEAPESGTPAVRPARTPRRRAPRGEPVVSIDDVRTVQTTAEKIQSDLLDLVESMKTRRVITGTIQGVERSEDNPNMSFAVIYHGEFKVIIPAEETVEPPADFRDRLPGDVMHYLVTKRLGTEVDYIVKGIDRETGIAAASRLEAMAAKRREYYFGSDRDGNNLLYEGISAEARVVSVIRAGIFIDLFGVECYIPLRELSYQRWVDAGSHYQAGQRVLVKILSIDRSDRRNIRVTASVKQAGENPYEKALRRYTIGSRYVGTVSMVDINGVFVSLDGGIDCLCSYPKLGRPPRGSRVTVRILGLNHETNRIWGAITHMTTR